MKSRDPSKPHRHGEVIASHGRHYAVTLDDGLELRCFPRGKRSDIACGDRVRVQITGEGQGVIEAVDPRHSVLFRSDAYKQKLIAANVTQVAIVVAATPTFYDEMVTRCLVAASAQSIHSIIVLNKMDLEDAGRIALQRLTVYADLGYRIVSLSAHSGDLQGLRKELSGERTVLVGQSGMGKSTLINALVPQAAARVGDISLALDSGRHTTTATRMYRLDDDAYLIDSPGMQEFGIAHVSAAQLMAAFPEFQGLVGHCRFLDCLHLSEPGCAVEAQAHHLNAERLRLYRKLAKGLRDRNRSN